MLRNLICNHPEAILMAIGGVLLVVVIVIGP
jgi:hypothetical protein